VNTAPGECIDQFHALRNYLIVAPLVVVHDVDDVHPCEGGRFVDRSVETEEPT
jgi:hypothetical protein